MRTRRASSFCDERHGAHARSAFPDNIRLKFGSRGLPG
jgi:hypothetical protein